MRILHITSAKNFGGGERHLVDLCRGLRSRGNEIFIALRPTAEWRDRLDFIPPENFHSSSIRNSFGMFNAKRISAFLDRHEIDIIHAHAGRDYLAASLAGRMSRSAAFVLTRHVMFPMRPFHKLALSNLSAAIAVSPGVEARLREIFPTDKIRLVPNGLNASIDNAGDVSRDEFREFHNIPRDALVIGTIGELKPLKGQRDLILAAGEIVKRFPDTYFVVAGVDNTIDQKFRRELRRLVGVLGMKERFLWLDWIENTGPFFAGLDIFVSPSHSESFGLATLEAMARGRAVVATDTDGARLLLDGAGELVPIEDPIKLADSICRLIEDVDQRTELADRLRSIANEHYSLEKMIDSTVDVYREILSRRPTLGNARK